MDQESRFVQTRQDPQRVLEEIALLGRGEVGVDEYLRRFLQLTLIGIAGRGGAVWVAKGGEFQRACSTKFEDSEYDSDELQRRSVQNALTDASENRRPVVVGPYDAGSPAEKPKGGGIVNHTAFPFFYVPIVVRDAAEGGRVPAVLQVWVSANVDPKNYQQFIAFLQVATGHAAQFLRVRRIESQAANTEKLQQLLRLASEMSGQLDPVALGVTIVNFGREIIGCDRCCLFGVARNGHLRALAISSVEVVNESSSLVQCQKKLAQEAFEAGKTTLFRKASPKTEALGDISDYFFHSHANEALAIPLLSREGTKVGVLLVESHKEKQFDESMQKMAVAVAAQSGRALTAAQRVVSLPFFKFLTGLERAETLWRADRRKWLLIRIGAPVAVILLLALLPWQFAVRGDCTVLPTVRAFAVAEISGRVVEVRVTEGQKVSAGQILAHLDDTELQQTLLIAQQEKVKYESEADRQQTLRDEGGRRIALINAERVVLQMNRLRSQITKTYIRSPINGVVLTKDLETRLGEVLTIGSRFGEIGDLSRWQVALAIKEGDVAILELKLQQGKQLPVTFLLHSMPTIPMTAVLKDVGSLSQISYPSPHGNVFVVKADMQLTAQQQELMKASYSGRGKIHAGWRPAGYIATRRFLNYVRTQWLL